MTLYTLLDSVFHEVLVSPVHDVLVPLQSLPWCPPTSLQCLCACHGDNPLWRWFQETASAWLHSTYIVEAYRLWLVRTLHQIEQWALIPPEVLCQRSTLKEMWRVQTCQQATHSSSEFNDLTSEKTQECSIPPCFLLRSVVCQVGCPSDHACIFSFILGLDPDPTCMLDRLVEEWLSVLSFIISLLPSASFQVLK